LDNKNKELEGVLNDRYKMVKKIGEGAQGTVYEVEDLAENRKR
jgi:serine/threonine protein kinase